MRPRVKNPVLSVPGAVEAAQKLGASATAAGISKPTPCLQHFAGLFGREG